MPDTPATPDPPPVAPDAAAAAGSSEQTAAERLTFFSDAVVAIAITILAIELPVPRGESAAELATALAGNVPSYLTFLLSFVVIARHWVTHHRVFRYVERTSTPVTWLNFGWLLLIVVIPFLTEVLDEGELNIVGFGLYAATQALQVLVFALIVLILGRRRAFTPGAPESLGRDVPVMSAVVAFGFLVGIPLSVSYTI